MLDFNSRGAEALSGSVNWFIDQALEAERAAQPRREYLGASMLGHSCERKVYYDYVGAPPDEGKGFGGQSLRIFERGHAGEDLAARWFQLAGFLLITANPKTGRQFEFQHPVSGAIVAGHCDGILAGFIGRGEAPFSMPALWECKVLGEKGWKKLAKESLGDAYPQYRAQMQLYMGELGLVEHPGVITAVNANTMELHHELVPYMAAEHQLLLARAERIVLMAGTEGELPPRVTMDPSWWQCRWCDYQVRCWNAGGE